MSNQVIRADNDSTDVRTFGEGAVTGARATIGGIDGVDPLV